MNLLFILVLLGIFLYTFGFAMTIWKAKQKVGAIAVIALSLIIAVLPFFSIF